MFGHLPEILLLLFVALIVFGPKRMIDMGSSFGKAFRELKEATKEMNWSNLLSTDAPETPKAPYPPRPVVIPTPPAAPTVVESTLEHVEEPSAE